MRKLLVLVAIVSAALFSVGHAHAAGPLRALGIQGGYTNPDNLDGTWNAGLFMEVGAPMVNMYVQPFVNYWNQSISATAGSIGAGADMKDWSVGANLKWVFPISAPKVRPFIAGGASVHILSSSANASLGGLGSLSFNTSDTKLGAQFGGGLELDVSQKVSLVGQSFYHTVSNFNQWSIGGALQLHL